MLLVIVAKHGKVRDSSQGWKIKAAVAVQFLWRDMFARMVPLRTSFGPCSGEEADRLFGNHALLKKLLKIASPAENQNEDQLEEAKAEAVELLNKRFPHEPKGEYLEWPIDRMKLFSVALIGRIRGVLKEKASKKTIDSLNALEKCIFSCLYLRPPSNYESNGSAHQVNISNASMELITETGKKIVNGLPPVGTNSQALRWITQKLRPWSSELEIELQRAMESMGKGKSVDLQKWTAASSERDETEQKVLTLKVILQLYSPGSALPDFTNLKDVSEHFKFNDASVPKNKLVWLAIDKALKVFPLLFHFPDHAHPPEPSTLGHVPSSLEAASVNECCDGVWSVHKAERVSGAHKRKATDPNSESKTQIRCLTAERGLSRDGDEAELTRDWDALDTTYTFQVYKPSVFDDE